MLSSGRRASRSSCALSKTYIFPLLSYTDVGYCLLVLFRAVFLAGMCTVGYLLEFKCMHLEVVQIYVLYKILVGITGTIIGFGQNDN